ncbi:uncharacterized protein LOC124144656 isoform X2 [Haliotis rufescens]|uniref:uncharacterized protein LOC124144656 isoform X2 n=1 Tax=Haliotis rufescens TaxID=6454 RepID=UPI00201FA4E8|nr:uncharacterized protein LOC124144656 isoform X2 [Haliotis rufescens]
MFPLTLLLLAMHCVSGEDFLTVMAYKTRNTYVYAIAGETGGLLQVQYPHFAYGTSTQCGSFRSTSVSIDEKMKIASAIEPKVIIVSPSDADMLIEVRGESRFSPLPISALGTKYIVPSDSKYTGQYQKLLVVATHNQSTDVEINWRIAQGYVNVNGHNYRDGDSVSIGLGPYQTLTILTQYDINGTVISASDSGAVYAGIIYNNTYTAYDQLLPVKHYGQEFVVVVETPVRHSQLQVTTEQRDTQIKFNSGAAISLGQKRFYQQTLYRSLHVSATRPVMVTLIRRDGAKSVFATIPPVQSYVNHTREYVPRLGSSYGLKICTRKTDSVVIQKKNQYRISVDWEEISGSGYKVGAITSSVTSLYSSISSDYPFTVLEYYTGSNPFHCYHYSFSPEEAATNPFRGRTYLMALTRFQYSPEIRASTGKEGGQWQIQNPYTGKIWSRQVKPFNTDYFYPQYSVNTTNGIQNKTMLIHVESVEIQIRGLGGYTRFSPLPISALGTKYVMTSCHPSGGYISLMVIATHSKKTDVDITFRLDGNVTYDNKTYTHGDTLSLTLMEYQTFTINSSSDLTGTVVAAEETIAVYTATYKAASYIRLIAYEQLLPNSHHGHEYVVAIRDNSPERYHSSLPYQLQVVTDHSDTQIRFNDGSSVSVGDTRVYKKRYGPRTHLYFNTTHPVMTTLCIVAGSSGYFKQGLFTVLPPVKYHTKQSTLIYGGTLQILTDKGSNNVHVERRYGSTVNNIHVDWTPIPRTTYKVGTCTVGSSTFIRSNTSFGVLGYSNYRIDNGGFSFKSPDHTQTTQKISFQTPLQGPMFDDRTTPTIKGQTPLQGPLFNNNAAMIVVVCCGVIIVSLLVGFIGYVLYVRRKMKSSKDNCTQRHPAPPTPTESSLNAPFSQRSNIYLELDRRNSPENFYENIVNISDNADNIQA